MITYHVFTLSGAKEISYGSRRVGVPSSSTSLGTGRRELEMIVDAHGLIPCDIIWMNGDWLKIEHGDELYSFLPPYEDESITFGHDHWSPVLTNRLLREAEMMQRRDR